MASDGGHKDRGYTGANIDRKKGVVVPVRHAKAWCSSGRETCPGKGRSDRKSVVSGGGSNEPGGAWESNGGTVTYFIYSGCSFISFLFASLALPETKGKTLEQIEAYWHHRHELKSFHN